MNSIETTFNKSRVFLPVIHPVTVSQAYKSIAVAIEAKADGLFLIDQGLGIQDLLKLAANVRAQAPKLWIGMNLLGEHPVNILKYTKNINIQGVWKDTMFPLNDRFTTKADKAFHDSKWDGLFFAGVNFKYQPPVDNLPEYLKWAITLANVITTSGPGTGQEADISKIRTFRKLLGEHSLALASGVTVDNIYSYLPYVDAYLVGTGIEDSFGVLNPNKTKELAERIHSYA